MLVTCEVRASDVNKADNYVGSLDTVRKYEVRPAWMWLICSHTGLLALPPSLLEHLPLSFDLHVRR